MSHRRFELLFESLVNLEGYYTVLGHLGLEPEFESLANSYKKASSRCFFVLKWFISHEESKNYYNKKNTTLWY